eukprot:4148651-Prymnesium_polylepis.2
MSRAAVRMAALTCGKLRTTDVQGVRQECACRRKLELAKLRCSGATEARERIVARRALRRLNSDAQSRCEPHPILPRRPMNASRCRLVRPRLPVAHSEHTRARKSGSFGRC